jgi:hypothetical protein
LEVSKKPKSGEANPATDIANRADDPPSASPRARMSWAQLLKRVFAIDITTCPQCGGPLTILAAIEDPSMIIKILSYLGLPIRAPTRGSWPALTNACRPSIAHMVKKLIQPCGIERV